MSNPVVKIQQGEIRGVAVTNDDCVKYYSFQGIPYAEPPIGYLRFKDPVLKKPWEGVKDATKEGSTALQYDVMITKKSVGSEDCLFINVHTPRLPSNETDVLPVMVNIHGGGFAYGSGNKHDKGPEYLIEEGVVYVSFNYRLGIFGFLCTDAVNARGDMGLKDQNLALQWVQQNISAFGGDSNNVTLFGISAGSASVEYQLLSPYSKGLFHKAIMQSGSTLNPWARTRNGVKKAEMVAEALGYNAQSGETLFDFINKTNGEDLVAKAFVTSTDENMLEGELFPFTPVINELEDYDGFIKGEPYDLLKSGSFNKVPIISGFCGKEGLVKLIFPEILKSRLIEGRFFDCVPSFFNKKMNDCDEKFKAVYNNDVSENVVDFLSDLTFCGGIWASLKHRLAHNLNNEYAYQFAYDGSMNYCKIIMQINEPGACHGDDVAYIFTNVALSDHKATPSDVMVRRRMVKMWTDFAKTGNPTPEISDVVTEKWIPSSKDDYNCLDIKADAVMATNLYPERRQLWLNLHESF